MRSVKITARFLVEDDVTDAEIAEIGTGIAADLESPVVDHDESGNEREISTSNLEVAVQVNHPAAVVSPGRGRHPVTDERPTETKGEATTAACLTCAAPATEWDGLCAECARLGDAYLEQS